MIGRACVRSGCIRRQLIGCQRGLCSWVTAGRRLGLISRGFRGGREGAVCCVLTGVLLA